MASKTTVKVNQHLSGTVSTKLYVNVSFTKKNINYRALALIAL